MDIGRRSTSTGEPSSPHIRPEAGSPSPVPSRQSRSYSSPSILPIFYQVQESQTSPIMFNEKELNRYKLSPSRRSHSAPAKEAESPRKQLLATPNFGSEPDTVPPALVPLLARALIRDLEREIKLDLLRNLPRRVPSASPPMAGHPQQSDSAAFDLLYPISPDDKRALGFVQDGYSFAGPSGALYYPSPTHYSMPSFGNNDYGVYPRSAPTDEAMYDGSVSPILPIQQSVPYVSPTQYEQVAPYQMQHHTEYASPPPSAYPGWRPPYYASDGHQNGYAQMLPPQQLQIANPPLHGSGTISPTAIRAGAQPLPSRSFGEIMTGHRSSISSISSDESGPAVYDDWTSAQQALGLELNGPSSRHATVPGPAPRRSTPISPYRPNIDETVRQYVRSPNRLAFGERKIMVMSPKVGQKSYGNEKRFLCPQPQAILIGPSWWQRGPKESEDAPLLPPRVNISLATEEPARDGAVSWSTIEGRDLSEVSLLKPRHAKDVPFFGTVPARNTYITDPPEAKKKGVKALVKVKAPYRAKTGPEEWARYRDGKLDPDDGLIGTFESKEIKIISKPSKKKSTHKPGDPVIQHGTTVALFNRVKAQTTSTRHLSIVPDLTRIFGSDGKPVTGALPPNVSRQSKFFPGFTADQYVWESFIIWLVDPTRPAGPGSRPPLHPGWPVAPANAFPTGDHAPSLRYNSTVVLQSLQTGYCSPTLILRRVGTDTDAVGMDGIHADSQASSPEGELAGDLVSQIAKVAFEIYAPLSSTQQSGSYWLSCDRDMATERLVTAPKTWTSMPLPKGGSRPGSAPNTPRERMSGLPMTPYNPSINLPGTPASTHSSGSSDYFGSYSRNSSSSALMISPASGDVPLPSMEGGPVRRPRTGSAGRAIAAPFSRPVGGHRKKMSGDVGTSASYEHLPFAAMHDQYRPERKSWNLQIGETCVWSIVGTEQITYTFYIPDATAEPADPIAPYPVVDRLSPPSDVEDDGHSIESDHIPTPRPLITLISPLQANQEDAVPGSNSLPNSNPNMLYITERSPRGITSQHLYNR